MEHYGGTLGLYQQPREEQVRVLSYYSRLDDLAEERARERKRLKLIADAANNR